MIRTRREYEETQRQVTEYNDLVALQRSQLEAAGLTADEVDNGLDPLLTFQAQVKDELDLYDRIRRRDFSLLHDLSDMGRLLIALRIARGLTQRELAQRLEVHESQVSRDERNEYYGITLERANEIIKALGETVRLEVEEQPLRIDFPRHISSQATQTIQRTDKVSLGESAVDTTFSSKTPVWPMVGT
jgi:transcriptional regulator with XRE-family HTH domain